MYVQIGDADATRGVPLPGMTARVFDDPAAGDVIGRWSWTDPKTTYYTLRFGPRRRAHGHYDRGSLTWSTLGSRVLVGPGRYAYNTTPYALWRTTAAAHNVAIPATGAYNDRGSSVIAAVKVQARAHAWVEKDTLYPRAHTRGVNVNTDTHTLSVSDTYSGVGMFANCGISIRPGPSCPPPRTASGWCSTTTRPIAP